MNLIKQIKETIKELTDTIGQSTENKQCLYIPPKLILNEWEPSNIYTDEITLNFEISYTETSDSIDIEPKIPKHTFKDIFLKNSDLKLNKQKSLHIIKIELLSSYNEHIDNINIGLKIQYHSRQKYNGYTKKNAFFDFPEFEKDDILIEAGDITCSYDNNTIYKSQFVGNIDQLIWHAGIEKDVLFGDYYSFIDNNSNQKTVIFTSSPIFKLYHMYFQNYQDHLEFLKLSMNVKLEYTSDNKMVVFDSKNYEEFNKYLEKNIFSKFCKANLDKSEIYFALKEKDNNVWQSKLKDAIIKKYYSNEKNIDELEKISGIVTVTVELAITYCVIEKEEKKTKIDVEICYKNFCNKN